MLCDTCHTANAVQLKCFWMILLKIWSMKLGHKTYFPLKYILSALIHKGSSTSHNKVTIIILTSIVPSRKSVFKKKKKNTPINWRVGSTIFFTLKVQINCSFPCYMGIQVGHHQVIIFPNWRLAITNTQGNALWWSKFPLCPWSDSLLGSLTWWR